MKHSLAIYEWKAHKDFIYCSVNTYAKAMWKDAAHYIAESLVRNNFGTFILQN